MNFKEAKFKQDINKIEVPEQQLDLVIRQAMRKSRKNKKRPLITGSIVAASIATFLFTANVSPTFASYISDIPLLNKLIHYVQYDKGLFEAIENGYNQEVHAEASDQGIVFSIDNVIADQKRMIIMFSAQADGYPELEELMINDMTITDEAGNTVISIKDGKYQTDENPEVLPLWTFFPEKRDGEDRLRGSIELVTQHVDAKLPERVFMNIETFVQGKQEVHPLLFSGTWNVSFDVMEGAIQEVQSLVTNKEFTLSLDELKLENNIDHVISYPTMTEVKISLLSRELIPEQGLLYSYHLVDEEGRVYNQIGDGILTDTGDVIPQFETTYFKQPKELYLIFTEVKLTSSEDEKVFHLKHSIRLY
ncbi:DUF4179 domain-containing protein [Anaerobacillus alkaliphilus]|uniref:DUF4179 domain-containing protein n=1 Tax=Anaerobacillus alkaliphilus TaxID=1548597 RepID=A0A4Q0VXU3_9BACI|nr:DUF4179 domain-containing protein [Anaerobacillus alkaliphilus]RXJ04573.1 DUF4179 domain-containing protein [Anaerobacillus alkaliphilus]